MPEYGILTSAPIWVDAGKTCEKHGDDYIIVEPVGGGRLYICTACMYDLLASMRQEQFDAHDRYCELNVKLGEAAAEIQRLERRFLEETRAHDTTRHRLECRERELERIRSNMYRERVESWREAL